MYYILPTQMVQHSVNLALKICVVIKIVIIVKMLKWRSYKAGVEQIVVEDGLGQADNRDGTFRILNQEWLHFVERKSILKKF